MANKQKAQIDVSDSGKLIAPTDMQKLFEPYYTTKSAGSGLGLSIVRRIVEAHGGEITVENNLGGGATFTVLLPIKIHSTTTEFADATKRVPPLP